MTEQKVCFVIGAGASKSAGFPLGPDLAKSIQTLFLTHRDFDIINQYSLVDRDFTRALLPLSEEFSKKELENASIELVHALDQGESIDRILHVNSENPAMVRLGKLAITYCILNAEFRSTLKIPPGNIYNRLDFNAAGNSWYRKLWQLIFYKYSADELLERAKQLKFVVFNYDRCIEHYLYESFKNCYPSKRELAYQFISNIEFIHPYGQVGALPYDEANKDTESQIIGFGQEVHSSRYAALSAGIRVYTEGVDPGSGTFETIQKTIEATDKLVVLGFGFMDLNLKILKPSRRSNHIGPRKIFATAFREYDFNKNWIEQQLNQIVRPDFESYIFVDNTADCLALLTNYSNGIADN
ncbi:hypothetical protein [Maritalea sp.]|jgi:hypothetical protein|uniref:hypothetical protein n=1 Tax=Maritalea sp. TaxID=2003361 RepID=UPI0039E49AD3